MEIWKDIIGYEGIYQISNQGKVRSLDRDLTNTKGKTMHFKGKILKPVPNSNGYLRVCLKANGKNERWFVHRLVAFHFVENSAPDIYTVVNHIDSDYLNNSADNLEWTTIFGNMHHAIDNGRMKRTEEWIKNLNNSLEKHRKPVIGYDPDTGEVVVVFKGINECGRCGFEASCVCDCCKGKRKTHRGLAWKYADQTLDQNLKQQRG